MSRRIVRGAVLAPLAVAALAAPAAAHVTVQPAESRPGDLQRYSVYVPNEQETDTTAVAVRVPEGVDFLLAEPSAGFRARVVRQGDRITEVRWTGGRIAPEQYAELHFIARNPAKTGPVTWPAVQTYAGGEVARWIGGPDSDEPAPRTTLSESATPVDVVSTHGEAAGAERAQAGEGPAPAAEESDDDEDGDGPALWLSIAALAAALAALAVALTGRRRRKAAGGGDAW